ncbi:ABC transporter ATP-binding protein, partial [Candidatus Woesearchaeota archaeon]|nr:ABC transporter ATP-binding protein [Candidatus Woesearchaeota archaeon]
MRPFLKKALRILKYAKPHWKIVVSLLLVSLFLSVLGLVNPYLLKILIDDVLINKDIVLLFWLMIVFILIFIVESAAQIYYSYETKALGERIVLDVKTELFNHIERMDMQFHERKKIGDTLTRIDSDVYGIDSFIGIAVQDIILNLLASIAILIVCFNLNWKVTLTSLIF